MTSVSDLSKAQARLDELKECEGAAFVCLELVQIGIAAYRHGAQAQELPDPVSLLEVLEEKLTGLKDRIVEAGDHAARRWDDARQEQRR